MAIIRQADQGALEGAAQHQPVAGKHPGSAKGLVTKKSSGAKGRARSAPAAAVKHDRQHGRDDEQADNLIVYARVHGITSCRLCRELIPPWPFPVSTAPATRATSAARPAPRMTRRPSWDVP